jgi:hypothetical protein
MRLKQVWRPRICRLVLRSWELGGRRDRQRPEEKKFGLVVEWDSVSIKNSSTVVETRNITIRPGCSVDEKRICAVCLGGS